MNWVDLVGLGVILISGVLALARGLVRELLGLGAWLAAALLAWRVAPLVQPWTRQQFSDPALADTVSFLAVFVVVLVVLSVVAGIVSGAIRGSVLGGLDRTLGLVFGLLRGAVLLCAAYIVVGLAVAVDQWPAPVREARALPFVFQGATWMADELPPGIRPAVAPPPGRTAAAAELMQANPVGRPLGARPNR